MILRSEYGIPLVCIIGELCSAASCIWRVFGIPSSIFGYLPISFTAPTTQRYI